jgi:sarcosine oxidase
VTVYGPNHIFEFAVIGGGMFGSAAARHLVAAGHDVVLLAPPEPDDRASHEGPFASHHDEARITRIVDSDPLWSELARASIERYGEIESESQVTFHHPCGYLGVGTAAPLPSSAEPGRLDSGAVAGEGYLAASLRVGEAAGVALETLEAPALAERFPALRFNEDERAFLEPAPAGYINPRALVRAQTRIARNRGVTVLPRTALQVTDGIDAVDVLTDTGERVLARRALVAAGAYTNELLVRPLDLRVEARTLLFARLDRTQRHALADMPSVIHVPAEGPVVYVLPPVTYPDLESYVKIGVDGWHAPLETAEAIGDWFRSEDGNADEVAAADRALSAMIPSIAGAPRHTSTCVYTITASGYPYVGMVSERLAVCVGGNGKGAKSSDEIGRLGAVALSGGHVDERLHPRFA